MSDDDYSVGSNAFESDNEERNRENPSATKIKVEIVANRDDSLKPKGLIHETYRNGGLTETRNMEVN